MEKSGVVSENVKAFHIQRLPPEITMLCVASPHSALEHS
jgi:hypothetical protein